MADEAKIIRDVLALESYSMSGSFRKSLSGAESLNPMHVPMANVVSTPISTAPVNSTTTPTPTASLATRPR